MQTSTILIIILIPTISALIGWLTNLIAIKSLFYPLKEKKILFFKFQGLLPKRQKKLAQNLSEVIEKYLLSHKDILEEIKKPSNIEKIKEKLVPILTDKILEKIPPMFQSIAKPLIESTLEKESNSLISNIIDELEEHLQDLNLKDIIRKKIENYDTKNLEKIINKVAKEELKHIEFLGGLIGFIVGLFQLGLFFLL